MVLLARFFRLGTPDAKTNPRNARPLYCNQNASSGDSLGDLTPRNAALWVAFVVTVRLEELPALTELGPKTQAAFAGSPLQLKLIGLLNVAPTDGKETV